MDDHHPRQRIPIVDDIKEYIDVSDEVLKKYQRGAASDPVVPRPSAGNAGSAGAVCR